MIKHNTRDIKHAYMCTFNKRFLNKNTRLNVCKALIVQAQLYEMCAATLHCETWQQQQSLVDYGDDPLGDSPLSDAIFRGTEGERC